MITSQFIDVNIIYIIIYIIIYVIINHDNYYSYSYLIYTAATIHTRNGLMMTVSKRNNQSKTQSSLLSSSTGTIANTKEETKI